MSDFVLSFEAKYAIIIFVAAFVSFIIGLIPTDKLFCQAKASKKWLCLMVLADILRGAAVVIFTAIVLSRMQIGSASVFIMSAAFLALIGSSKSAFSNGNTASPLAVLFGTILALNWQAGLILAAVWGAVTFVTKKYSAGLIIALILAPFLMFLFNNPLSYAIYCAISALYMLYLYRKKKKKLVKGLDDEVK